VNVGLPAARQRAHNPAPWIIGALVAETDMAKPFRADKTNLNNPI